MKFLLDHNVLGIVQRCLEEHNHDVAWSRDLVGQDAEDPIVAAAAMEGGRILVSHDNDMKRIQRHLSDKHRARFPTLSRIMFNCEQAHTPDRLRAFMPIIQLEFDLAKMGGSPLLVYIQKMRVVINR